MESKILSKKELTDGVQTTLHISNKDKSNITTAEIKAIITKFSGGGCKILVRALNIERWCTLKGMNEEFDEEAYLEYYKNKVREQDLEKFTEFKQVQISVFKTRPK
jgi:hypothetical protein